MHQFYQHAPSQSDFTVYDEWLILFANIIYDIQHFKKLKTAKDQHTYTSSVATGIAQNVETYLLSWEDLLLGKQLEPKPKQTHPEHLSTQS